jgi:hypothetical protein
LENVRKFNVTNLKQVIKSINYLIDHNDQLRMNSRVNEPIIYNNEFLKFVILPEESAPKIITNLSHGLNELDLTIDKDKLIASSAFDELYPINIEDKLTASFAINANPNCFVAMYQILNNMSNSPPIMTIGLEPSPITDISDNLTPVVNTSMEIDE